MVKSRLEDQGLSTYLLAYMIPEILKFCTYMLVGASRAVLGAQGCGIQWTAGMDSGGQYAVINADVIECTSEYEMIVLQSYMTVQSL